MQDPCATLRADPMLRGARSRSGASWGRLLGEWRTTLGCELYLTGRRVVFHCLPTPLSTCACPSGDSLLASTNLFSPAAAPRKVRHWTSRSAEVLVDLAIRSATPTRRCSL